MSGAVVDRMPRQKQKKSYYTEMGITVARYRVPQERILSGLFGGWDSLSCQPLPRWTKWGKGTSRTHRIAPRFGTSWCILEGEAECFLEQGG